MRINWELLIKLGDFQLRQEEKLKTFATLDQVRALVDGFFNAARRVLESQIDDPELVGRCLVYVAAEIRQLANSRQTIGLLGE